MPAYIYIWLLAACFSPWLIKSMHLDFSKPSSRIGDSFGRISTVRLAKFTNPLEGHQMKCLSDSYLSLVRHFSMTNTSYFGHWHPKPVPSRTLLHTSLLPCHMVMVPRCHPPPSFPRLRRLRAPGPRRWDPSARPCRELRTCGFLHRNAPVDRKGHRSRRT